jgi:hypothetical protein
VIGAWAVKRPRRPAQPIRLATETPAEQVAA